MPTLARVLSVVTLMICGLSLLVFASAQGVSGPFTNVDVQGPDGAEVGRGFSIGCPPGSFVTGFTVSLATSGGKDVLVALLGPSVECSSDDNSTVQIQTAARLQLPTHRNITIYPKKRSDGFSGVTLHHGEKYVNAVSFPPGTIQYGNEGGSKTTAVACPAGQVVTGISGFVSEVDNVQGLVGQFMIALGLRCQRKA